jgi:hypothetical protein
MKRWKGFTAGVFIGSFVLARISLGADEIFGAK